MSIVPSEFKELINNLALIDTIKSNVDKHNSYLNEYIEDIDSLLTEQNLTQKEQKQRISDYFTTQPRMHGD